MKQLITIILVITMSFFSISTTYSRERRDRKAEHEMPTVNLKPIFVFERGIDEKRFWRLVSAVKRVYPLAKVAQEKMQGMEEHIATLETKKEERAYVKSIYKEIKEEYTPVLLKMTYTDGRVLIRLIDRETDYTAYEVLDEFKGGFTAMMWQGVGRLFGHNLKDEYGSAVEDQMIEKIIRFYEAGLL